MNVIITVLLAACTFLTHANEHDFTLLARAIQGCGAKAEIKGVVAYVTLPERIQFESNEAKLKWGLDSIECLDKILSKTPHTLTLVGHTDAVGDAHYNYELGLSRASAVARELDAADGDLVEIQSNGEAQLSVPTQNESVENRCVEIVLN